MQLKPKKFFVQYAISQDVFVLNIELCKHILYATRGHVMEFFRIFKLSRFQAFPIADHLLPVFHSIFVVYSTLEGLLYISSTVCLFSLRFKLNLLSFSSSSSNSSSRSLSSAESTLHRQTQLTIGTLWVHACICVYMYT